MEMKKRLLTMLLATTMVLGVTACGTPAETTTEETPAETTSTEETTEEAGADSSVPDMGGEEILVWLPPFGSEEGINDQDFWTEQLADATTAMNATLKLEAIPWENYEEKYLTGITGGTGPDVGYMYTEMLKSYIDMGALEQLDSYFTQEEIDNYIYWDYGTVDGAQYTVPFVVGFPRILYCNMDLLNAAGYDAPPTTWAELEEISLAVTETTGKVGFQQYWGGYFGDLMETFYPYLWSAGGEIFDEEGNLVVNSEAGVEAATWIYSLKEKGIITESATSLDGSAVMDAFRNGEVAMYVSSTSTAAKTTDAGINWDFAPYLMQEEGQEGYTTAAADALVMLSTASNKDAAAYLIKAITSPAVMEQFHERRYSGPPISEGEAYLDNPVFETMYAENTENFRTLPVVAGASSVYDSLFSNLQLMMLGELTPQEALDNTVTYSESLL